MKKYIISDKKSAVVLLSIVIPLVIIALGRWIYGWGGGDIDILDFSAEGVERVELYTDNVMIAANYATEFDDGFGVSVVTEPEDIQLIIDQIDSLQYAGNDIRDYIEHGIGIGGTVHYDTDFYFRDGTELGVTLSSNSGSQPVSDRILGYSLVPAAKKEFLGKNARGSLEWFYDLYEKYRPIPGKETS